MYLVIGRKELNQYDFEVVNVFYKEQDAINWMEQVDIKQLGFNELIITKEIAQREI